MSNPRLPFLYPFLLGPARAGTSRLLPDIAQAGSPSRPRIRLRSTLVEAARSTASPADVAGLSSSVAQRSTQRYAESSRSSAVPSSKAASSLASRSSPVTTSRSTASSSTRSPAQSVTSRPPPRAGFVTSLKRRRPATIAQRYGTANEPPPGMPPIKQLPPKEATPAQRKLPAPEPGTAQSITPFKTLSAPPPSPDKQTTDLPPSLTRTGDRADDPLAKLKATTPDQTASTPKGLDGAQPSATSSSPSAKNETALATILRMDAEAGTEKPPHLQAPPYVHHFDTFTLVRQLQEGGFDEDQAVSMMKLMRLVLADNMDLAAEGIVSKSDAEMAAYLFRAACSELRTEVRNARSATSERMRTERATLQHEVDILAQRMTADMSALKDELKGMFDDRKMSVRIERRDVENRIQELHYKITTRLNSEMRSEVEGLRWVLVRRTAIALVSVVVMALMAIRANKLKEAKVERERKRVEGRRGGGGGGGELVAAGKAEGEGLGAKGGGVREAVEPELVSLG